MTTDEANPLARFKAQYRQVALRGEVRDKILRAIAEAPDAPGRTAGPNTWSWRSPSWRMIGWATLAVVVAAGALTAWSVQGRRPERLDAVVSAVSGQVFTDGVRTNLLGPKLHVSEGQWLHTSASGAVETKVGAHLVSVSPDSGLLFESLAPQDLRFRLERGSVRMTAAPLGPGGRLRVAAGELWVEVVGTVFEVRRQGDCSWVSVRSGHVRTWFQGQAGEVGAGQERQFCRATAALPRAESSPAESSVPADVTRDPDRRIASRSTAFPTAPISDEPSQPGSERLASRPAIPTLERPRSEPLSDEERMFRDASRGNGEVSSRALRLQEYLARFPTGMFAEDALFQLIRDSYAAADSTRVVDYSRQFLRRFQRGRRASEVRLLYVQSLIETGMPPGQSLDILESLLVRLDILPRSQQEQATYLAVLAYCGSHMPPLCRLWAERYLDHFPHGLYAAEVRKSQIEKIP